MSIKNKISKFINILCKPIASKKVLVIGDSHARVFKNLFFKLKYPFIYIDICSVEGATVSGLTNPNSKTNSKKIFDEKLSKLRNYDMSIFLMGEVDTGFVIWYRSKKYGVAVEEMLNAAVENYCSMLAKAIESKNDIVVLSAPLPTISDDNDWGEVAGLRKEVDASQLDRTRLTIKFNNHIESFCCNYSNVTYINLDTVSQENGVVASFLLNKNPNDHHYEESVYARLISKYIRLK